VKAFYRQARNNCRKLGMQLASVETADKNICVLKEIEKNGYSLKALLFILMLMLKVVLKTANLS
jgi:hypothetical protein